MRTWSVAWASVPRAQVVAVLVALSGQAVITNAQGGRWSLLGQLVRVPCNGLLLRCSGYTQAVWIWCRPLRTAAHDVPQLPRRSDGRQGCFEGGEWANPTRQPQRPGLGATRRAALGRRLHPRRLAPSSCRLKPQCLDARKGLAGLRRRPRLPKIVGGLLS
jgi:hypothetical protein